MIYLDYAAATPVDKSVVNAMLPYWTDNFYNPSATYLAGRKVRADLESARAKVAEIIGAKPREIVFTAGGTEANNLAVQGVLNHPALDKTNCFVAVSGVEHDSVLRTAQNFNCFVALTDKEGRVDLADLRSKITDQTVLVSVMYANNEVGTIQPIRQISTIIADIKAQRSKRGLKIPLYFHTDACQAANYLDLHISRLGVDMMTLNGGKIYGPKQSGVLFVASHVQLEPIIYGGGQERSLRSGTENVAQAVGFAKALEKSQMLRLDEAKRLELLQRESMKFIQVNMPTVVINGSLRHRLPNNLHLSFPGQDNETLMMQLENAGFEVAVGSACSASKEEPSHVLTAMGISEDYAQSSLRITFGRQTTEKEVADLMEMLKKITTL